MTDTNPFLIFSLEYIETLIDINYQRWRKTTLKLMWYRNRQDHWSGTYIFRSWGSFLKIPVASRTENSLLLSRLQEMTSISEKKYSSIVKDHSTLRELFGMVELNNLFNTGTWRTIQHILTFPILKIPVNEHSH